MKDKILIAVMSPVILAGIIWEVAVAAFEAGRRLGYKFL